MSLRELDLSSLASVAALGATLRDEGRPIHLLANNAGVVDRSTRFVEMSPARLQRMFAINVFCTMYCCRQAVQRMSTRLGGAGGAIVNLSSVAAVLGSPGTYVMDICAGNGGGSDAPGFAPEADMVFVDVSHSDIPFVGPQVVGSSFGDSTQLLEAVRYIFDKAGDRPCVVNISLGTNGGPHDGTTGGLAT